MATANDNRAFFHQQHQINRNRWLSATGNIEPTNIIYMKHNLKSNLMNANGANDPRAKTAIVMSEIAKMIVNNPDRVVRHLNDVGFTIQGRPSNRKLVKYVSMGIGNSKKFTTAIARDIVGDGGEGKFSAEGGTGTASTTPSQTVNWGEVLGGASGIVNGLGTLFGGKKKARAETEKARAEAAKAQAEAQKALAAATKGVAGANSGGNVADNTGLYIGIAVAVVVVVGGAIAWYKLR